MLLLIGGLTGYLLGYFRAQQDIFPEIETVPEINPGVTLMQPAEIKNNAVPEGALYVAGKRGKYYYSLLNERSFTIAPENRLYFKNAEEAERSGYLPAKE